MCFFYETFIKLFPREPGAPIDFFDRFTDISTNATIVTAYGVIDKSATSIYTPIACKLSCKNVIPPKI